MKRIVLLAWATLSCAIAAATAPDCSLPQDSVRKIKQFKKASDENIKLTVEKITDEEPKQKIIKPANAKDEATILKTNDGEIILEKPTEFERPKRSNIKSDKLATADEIKEMAKRESSNKVRKNKTKKATKPTVSYPSYPGGNVAIRDFVKKTQRYPQECKSERVRGRVEILVTITPEGVPTEPEIIKSSGNEYMNAEAMRVAGMLPHWTPAAKSDSMMEIKHKIFFNFRPGR